MSTETVTARREELLARLATESESLRASDGWQRWLAFAAKFRSYSLQNQLLIQSQCPTATYVAGYRTWQGLGRHVRKGERGIAILAPLVRRVVENDSEEKQRVLTGFKVVFVFDVTQTEGEAPPVPADLPDVGVPDEALRDRLIAAALQAGFPVGFVEADPGGARGWYAATTKTITLVASYSTPSQIRTLLHELGHAVDPVIGTPHSVRAERELVAESAAYIVGTELGLHMDAASTQYVTSWGADTALLTQLARQVLAAAEKVHEIVAGRPA